MESDEELARRLQEEFNREADEVDSRCRNDEQLAQKLAYGTHTLSDSDSEIEELNPSSDIQISKPSSSNQKSESDSNRKLEISSNHNIDCSTSNSSDRIRKNENSDASTIQQNKECSFNKNSEISTKESSTTICNAESSTNNKNLESHSPENTLDVPSTASKATAKRSLCKFGRQCYRKNPIHLAEFYHPESDETKDEAQTPPAKRAKVISDSSLFSQDPALPFDQRLKLSEPFNLFLNKSFSLPETHKDPFTLVFPDLLSPKLGKLVASCQINFMIDLDFVMEFYKAMKQDKTEVLFIYGQLEGDPKSYSNVTCKPVSMPFQYGVHHSKMMLLQYQEGCRVVIHTANLKEDDWTEKTQGFWVSPLFPSLPNGKASLLEGDSPTRFKHDLIDYLLSYKISNLSKWANTLKGYDMSSCNAFFVGSVPGYHTGESKFKFGHLKCRNMIRRYSNWGPRMFHPVVVQCSSIGSLGKDCRSWLTSELGVSLSGGTEANSNSTVKVVYPSEKDIQNSSQGWGGGSCLPYNSNTGSRQPWLKQHLHSWRSEGRKRSRAMPHIKTFARFSSDGSNAQYFVLTSSNLSKAAWGQMQKQGSQLFIRSYEAGVLLLPKLITSQDSFPVATSENKNLPSRLLLPYDLPLTPYAHSDIPWFMDTPKNKPDCMGNTYP